MHDISKTLYIGANFVSHDASVFGICDGTIFAISEERFTRFKHDFIWPIRSLDELRKHLVAENVYFNRIVCGVPMKSFEEQLVIDSPVYWRFMRKLIGGCYLKDYSSRYEVVKQNSDFFVHLVKALYNGDITPLETIKWIRARIFKHPLKDWVNEYLRKVFGNQTIEVRFYDHHDCHALSAFAMSGFHESLVITMDGWGDGCFSKTYIAGQNGIRLLNESCATKVDASTYDIPDNVRRTGIFSELSVGHAYSIITWLLGFTPNADEGKVEALAAYAKADKVLLAQFHSTVSVNGEKIVINPQRFIEVFHNKISHARIINMPRESVSATMQRFLEEVYLRLVRNSSEKHQIRQVCLAGGVTANVILNMKIFDELGLKVFVVPAMADDGTSMGAAFQALGDEVPKYNFTALDNTNSMPYYGTAYSPEDTQAVLESNHNLPIQWQWLGDEWQQHCAERICVRQEIGALFQGRCEFGPRALGNRSIVASLQNSENTSKINRLVKNRPNFQPFCPSFLAEERKRLFDNAYLNKHMTCAFRMKEKYVALLPCAVHVDNTARVQFVSATDNSSFHSLLLEVKKLSTYGGLLNTSFNKHGRTICENPFHAITDFVDCGIDFLFINGFLVTRNDK